MKLVIFLIPVLMAGCAAAAEHPEVLVNPGDREAIVAKIQDDDWAKQKYEKIKANVDELMRESGGDQQWLTSRLAMNWQTHFTTADCVMARFAGGEGHAPIPTPRFAGARDWATIYTAPVRIGDFRPWNDDAKGQIFLHDRESNRDVWVQPGLTGRTIESINQRVMEAAEDSAFVYWITGDKRYAHFAAGALMTYMQGFAYVTPPKVPAGDRTIPPIIGMTSFEVIHEDIVTPLALTYDFLYEYLKGDGQDVTVVQSGLKRMIQRVIDGGMREGNWNLNKARIIAYGALALEDDRAYADRRGREYFVNIVLNAQLPHQYGITHVIHHAFDEATAMWPEACGYGFGAAKDITLIASLTGNTAEGKAVLSDPILQRNVLAQANLTFPNGIAAGLGDTTDTRVNAEQLELLIAAARARGDAEMEGRFTSILRGEIDSGNDVRANSPDDLVALTKFVGELKSAPAGQLPLVRAFFGRPLNVLMLRNLTGDVQTSLAAAMYGTAGGHVHANGLAIELFGAGLKMGCDPGRGESYWTRDHAEYYSQPPAHNTVIVDGVSDYRVTPQEQIGMTVEHSEPAYSLTAESSPGLCANIGFAQCGFEYDSPPATQQRTLALVRPMEGTGGFYFDVFRSRAQRGGAQFHDYLYHDIGELESLTDSGGNPLRVEATNQLQHDGNLLRGYNYFSRERSIRTEAGWRARFGIDVGGVERRMDLWMPGQEGRTIFSVDGPANHEMRDNQNVMTAPMPTMIVRQEGSAWDRPFIAVYEPSTEEHPASIGAVELAKISPQDGGLAACVVRGKSSAYRAVLLQDDRAERKHENVEGVSFAGSFGAVIRIAGQAPEVYLGSGTMISDTGVAVEAADPKGGAIGAAVWHDGDGWRYSATGRVRVTLGVATVILPAAVDGKISGP